MKAGLHLSIKKSLILNNFNFQIYISKSLIQANFFNSNFINYNQNLLLLYDKILKKKKHVSLIESTYFFNPFEI